VIDGTGDLEDYDDEELFRASLGDMTALGLGVRNMTEAKASEGENIAADIAANVLKARLKV